MRRTDGIDVFCSSSPWIISFKRAFYPQKPVFIRRFEEGFAVLRRQRLDGLGQVLVPLEDSWCFASPLVAARPGPLVRDFAQHLFQDETQWDAVFIPGIRERGALWFALIRAFDGRARIYRGPETMRRMADLSEGMDGFWRNRSRKFRGNLRRDLRAAASIQPRFQYFSEPLARARTADFYLRLMAIESRGWKGRLGQGVDQGPMREFYRRLLAVLGPRGQYRAVIVSIADREVGYILGGVLDGVYRGFQFSFDSEYSHLALGNLLQLQMIEHLCDEGVTRYDLGMEAEYKRHWGELRFETASLLIRR